MRNIHLCVLTLALSASAYAGTAAAASRSITVDATSSGCQYTGGDNADGDVSFHVGTKATVAVHASAGYTLEVAITSDPNKQLSIPNPGTPTLKVIQDENSVAQEATYKVTLKDASGGATPCDPKIINN